MTILLTGAAGFIGMHVAEALLARGEKVIGIDSLTPYYDLRLKQARRDRLLAQPNFSFYEANIADRVAISELLSQNREVTQIIHLAAQPGVR
ncbi:MAG: GDP-mannose 4,6-dehydratase, partial [bacterium]